MRIERMARSDWVALVTEPAAEYVARTDLVRFGLEPYLPQIRRRCSVPFATRFRVRLYPLFPRYLLLPQRQLDRGLIRVCRGLSRVRPLLCDSDGRPWRAADHVVLAIKSAEQNGDFDENLMKGDKVKITDGILANIDAFLEKSDENTAELLTPLFGGASVKVARDRVARAD